MTDHALYPMSDVVARLVTSDRAHDAYCSVPATSDSCEFV